MIILTEEEVFERVTKNIPKVNALYNNTKGMLGIELNILYREMMLMLFIGTSEQETQTKLYLKELIDFIKFKAGIECQKTQHVSVGSV